MSTSPRDENQRATGPERGSSVNLSTILRRVHRSGPASRAELTRETGLNRSTISGLVAELVDRGLVVEVEPRSTKQVGRPSPVVQASPDVVAIAIVPEIDAITMALVTFDRQVLARRRFETETIPTVARAVEVSRSLLEELRHELTPGHRIAGIGVAVPGLVRAADGCVRWAPHLDWHDEPLGSLLEEATGFPVLAANDANLGARAENLFGAAVDATHMLYMNGGPSGIGGGIIVNGELVNGAEGYAGEFGHNRVAAPPDASATEGELEESVNQQRLLGVLGLRSASLDELEAALVADERPEVRAEVHRQLGILSVGVRNMINILNPEKVVLGGFLGVLFDFESDYFLDLLASNTLQPPWQSVTVVRAELGSDLLLIGAAELVFDGIVARAEL
ncbi:ROK family transcriptional regulator [Labedella endophytica]|uniref:ROK family transcriptional regulator n=1 Tax=Labedella endophytica TaxID=1523160 RepID=A0A3S0XKI0_9MICO|nr:ROK family transcriptional regulator [Labedella endophytica]RUQ98060.1 ROK family transcriptional regulator [Labedella endophytica]